jgi:hypothetical protein
MSYEDVVKAYWGLSVEERQDFTVFQIMEELQILDNVKRSDDPRARLTWMEARIPVLMRLIEEGTGIPFPETQTLFRCYCHPDMDEQEPEGGWDNWVCPCCKNTGWVEKQPNGEYLPYQP